MRHRNALQFRPDEGDGGIVFVRLRPIINHATVDLPRAHGRLDDATLMRHRKYHIGWQLRLPVRRLQGHSHTLIRVIGSQLGFGIQRIVQEFTLTIAHLPPVIGFPAVGLQVNHARISAFGVQKPTDHAETDRPALTIRTHQLHHQPPRHIRYAACRIGMF